MAALKISATLATVSEVSKAASLKELWQHRYFTSSDDPHGDYQPYGVLGGYMGLESVSYNIAIAL